MRARLFPTLALGAALATSGCQNPDGSTDWGSTLALGAGIGLAAGIVAASAGDRGRRHPSGSGARFDRGGSRRLAGDPGYRRGW